MAKPAPTPLGPYLPGAPNGGTGGGAGVVSFMLSPTISLLDLSKQRVLKMKPQRRRWPNTLSLITSHSEQVVVLVLALVA